MKLRRRIILPAVLLTAVLLIAGAGTVKAEDLDLNKTISLTVNPGPASMPELTSENVTIDLYKVADAKTDGAGGVAFTPKSGVTFSSAVDTYEAMQKLDNSAWLTLAQDAARSVIRPEKTLLDPEKDLTKLTSGLYLVIAHGTDLTKDQYASWNNNDLTTKANVGSSTYTWYPELIALPSTVSEMGASGTHEVITTAGEWQYTITAALKPAIGDQFGDLYITKVLPTYETTTPATFVFSVKATVDGQTEPVFDDVCSLTFDSNGSKTYRILNRIPVGAKVTVTEEYAGTRYKIKDDAQKTKTDTIISRDAGVLELTFENTYTPDDVVGYGILNEFTHGENGWVVNQN